MENLGVISDIKQCLLKDVLSDEKAVKLLTNSKDVTVPALDLRYKQVYPWSKVPETVEEEKTFVVFEVNIPSVVTKATRIYQLDVYVVTHERLMKIDEKVGRELEISDRGTRIDILADRIDYLINGSKTYTFDELLFDSSIAFKPIENFFARKMTYMIRGWNMIGAQLDRQV